MIDERCAQDAVWLRALSDAWKQHGLDAEALFREAGLDIGTGHRLDPAELSDKLSHLWELAVAATGDPYVGIRTAPRQPLGALGLIAHLILACPTMLQAMERLCQYVGFVLPTASARLDALPERVRLVLHLSPGRRPVPAQRYDFIAGLVLRLMEWMTGRVVAPQLIHHPRPAPADPAPYVESFHASVRFAQPICAMDFDRADLDVPLPTANPAVADWCSRLAADLEQTRRGQLRVRVKKVLVDRLPKGDPRRDEVAAVLRMSERTLQRRLSEEGTHFQELVDATRRELAQQYLSVGRMSPKEMSFELGFADPSNFYRACKRWFGHSPKALRQLS